MITVIVRHDNGCPGQDGFTEETLPSLWELGQLMADYEKAGIHIYSVTI